MDFEKAFSDAVDAITAKDSRFARGAYYFVRGGLDYTVEKIKTEKRPRPTDTPEHHVTGTELLNGIREFALNQYGPMAFDLLSRWGLRSSDNFGEIVFRLIEAKILGKSESDRKEDFNAGFDFKDAFVMPFRPSGLYRSVLPVTLPAATELAIDLPAETKVAKRAPRARRAKTKKSGEASGDFRIVD